MLELLIVIALAALLAAIAIPSFQTVMADSRRDQIAAALVGSLHLARSQAILIGGGSPGVAVTAVVNLQPIGGGAHAGPTWQHGWLVVNANDATTPLRAVNLPNPATGTHNFSNYCSASLNPPNLGYTAGAIGFTSTGNIDTATQGQMSLCGHGLTSGGTGMFRVAPTGCSTAVWITIDNLGIASVQPGGSCP